MQTSDLVLTTYDSAVAFRDRAQPFLMRQEAANNLMLGLATALVETPQRFDAAPFLATVERHDVVVAACMRTPPNNLILSTTDTPAALDHVAATLHAARSTLPGVNGPAALSASFAEHWQRLTGVRVQLVRSLRVFALDQVRPVTGVTGSLRRASRDDRPTLITWVTAFAGDAGTEAKAGQVAHAVDGRLDQALGGFWFWEVAGERASLVGATGPTPNGIRIGPVYTPPEHRRQGYASAATAAVSQLLLDAGRSFCFLYTDLANPTANHIYQTIGYEPVGDAADYAFHR